MDDVRGDFLGPPHGTTPAAVIANIDCRYTLELPHDHLCFGPKIRKIGIALHTPVLLYKSGGLGGSQCMVMFS